MEIYFNYGRYWWLAIPLAVLGLFSEIFMYAYWAAFVLLTVNLIFERTQGPTQSRASSVNVYNQATRVNWLNVGIAIFLAFSNILIVLIPIKSKVILIATFWAIGGFLLNRYIEKILWIIHKQATVLYLRSKLSGIDAEVLNQVVELYFPGDLPKSGPLQSRFGLSDTQTDKLAHYYDRYRTNNYVDGTLPRKNKTELSAPTK